MKREEIKNILHKNTYLVPEEAEFIYDTLKLKGMGRLLELGTGLGHSTVFFSKWLPGWHIYTVDAYGSGGKEPLVQGLTKGKVNNKGVSAVYEWLRKFDVNNVIQIVSVFEGLPWELDVDVIFIDGTHYYEDVKADFDMYSPFLNKGGYIIFDDYNDNWGVKELIDELDGWEVKHSDQTAIIWKKS